MNCLHILLLIVYVFSEAVKRSTANATNKEVEDAVKVWLKHAPKRLKSEEAAKE